MKKLLLILVLLLSGCATTQPVKTVIIPQKLNAPNNIMQDCPPFIKPQIGTFEDFMTTLLNDKKIYDICNLQNQSKKNFIKQYEN
jgi:hypothetical protein